jgi:hypothetical protein
VFIRSSFVFVFERFERKREIFTHDVCLALKLVAISRGVLSDIIEDGSFYGV